MAKQQDLPGMQSRKFPDIHEAAEHYMECRDARITASAPEVEAKKELMRLMHKHKRERYECEGLLVEITHEKEKVRVRFTEQEEEEAEAS